MKTKRHSAALAFLAAGTLTLTACGTDQNVPAGGGNPALESLQVECGTKPVSGEGSSAQKNAVDVFARDYGLKCPGQRVNYTKSGSGKGIAAFTAGQVDFGGSDSPLSEEKGEVAAAAQRVAVGRSTRADVAAALGAAETLRFESGHEVWVYRARGTRAPGESPELVILFGPDGLAKKVRARPAMPPVRSSPDRRRACVKAATARRWRPSSPASTECGSRRDSHT